MLWWYNISYVPIAIHPQDRRQWEEHLDRCLKQERDDMDRKRALAAENQDFIYGPTSW